MGGEREERKTLLSCRLGSVISSNFVYEIIFFHTSNVSSTMSRKAFFFLKNCVGA